MAGSPLKHERNRLVREAIMRTAPGGDLEGVDPVELMKPYAARLRDIALGEDAGAALSALKEIFDRVDGKPTQEIIAPSDEGRLVDAGLVGEMGEILRLARQRALTAKRAEVVIDQVEDDGQPDS